MTSIDTIIGNAKQKAKKAAIYLIAPLTMLGYGCSDLQTEWHAVKNRQGIEVEARYTQKRQANGISVEEIIEKQPDGDKIVYHNKRKDQKPGERSTRHDRNLARKYNGHIEKLGVNGKPYGWEDEAMRKTLVLGTADFDYLKNKLVEAENKSAQEQMGVKIAKYD